jgi:hypothetical protein
MTKVTELPFIGSATNATTSFIIVDNKLTKRITYNNFLQQLRAEIARADQQLFTTSSVTFYSLTATSYVSAFGVYARQLGLGGSLRQYIISQGDPAVFINNRVPGTNPVTISMQAYKSNFKLSDPYPFPIIKTDLSNGTYETPTAVNNGDILFSLSAGGHDGTTWISTRGHGNAGNMYFASQEQWGGTYGNTTNAGTRFSLTTHPPSIYLSTSTAQTLIFQYWSGYGQGQLPTNNIGFGGGADGVFHSNVASNGTVYQGHGSTRVYLVNSTFDLWGVPQEDSVPDNYRLPGTLSILFHAGRGNGITGRRNQIQKGDTLGSIKFFGETGTNSTSTDTQIKTAELFVKSLNTFTSTATGGAVVVLTTLNSGTNIESPRLSLSNVEHIYSSDIHSFKTANSSTIVTINTTSFVVKSVRAVQGTVPAGFSPMYFNTSTGEIIVVF